MCSYTHIYTHMYRGSQSFGMGISADVIGMYWDITDKRIHQGPRGSTNSNSAVLRPGRPSWKHSDAIQKKQHQTTSSIIITTSF